VTSQSPGGVAVKLACADFTFPLLSHERALSLIRMLDLEGLDLGLFGNRSHVRPETVRADIPMWSGILKERIERAGLELADFFFQPWSDFTVLAVNHPDPKVRDDAREMFSDMLELARRLKAPGITMLPGVRFGDDTWDDSIRQSAEELKWRVDRAAKHGIVLSVEGHLGSNVDNPEKLARLLDQTPGLKLTLDYTHFVSVGIPESDVDPLLPHARHFHCRGAAKGQLQATFDDNTIDYPRIVRRLREIGYAGYFGIEYTWSDWQNCNRTDNVSETIRFRDLARATLAQVESS
jgi:sugar phosphate isomerase/epimerase